MTPKSLQSVLINHLVTGCALSLAMGCSSDSPDPTFDRADIELELSTTSNPVPYSWNNEFAVIDDDWVCVDDSYEVQIVCGDREWTHPVSFGRKGRGPGELSGYGVLVSGPQGSVVIVDLPNRRTILYSRSGERQDWPMETRVLPATHVRPDSSLGGYALSRHSQRPSIDIAETDLAETVIAQQQLYFDPAILGLTEAMLSGAVQAPDGGFLVRVEAETRQPLLAYYTKDGHYAGMLEVPSFPKVLPDERDVAVWSEGYTQALAGQRPNEVSVQEFKSRPLRLFPRGALVRLVQWLPDGSVAALTTRRVDGMTLVDTYTTGRYAGSLRLHGRVISIQVRGESLVALTEDAEYDAVEPPRRIRWYRIHYTR